MTPHPKPPKREPKPRKPLRTKTRINATNPERLARLRAQQFPERPAVKPWCLVALKLAEYRRKHGAKQQPAGWFRCWGPVDPAHVVTRGAGGKADDVVDLCRGHHREQEGRTAEFEERYGVDLKAEAARLARARRATDDAA